MSTWKRAKLERCLTNPGVKNCLTFTAFAEQMLRLRPHQNAHSSSITQQLAFGSRILADRARIGQNQFRARTGCSMKQSMLDKRPTIELNAETPEFAENRRGKTEINEDFRVISRLSWLNNKLIGVPSD